MSESAAYVGDAAAELGLVQARRRRQAAEAQDVVARLDAAIAEQGVAKVLASTLASSLLQDEGDVELVAGGSGRPRSRGPSRRQPESGRSHLSEALNLLREAHRRGNEPLTLTAAEPMAPLVVGRCVP